MAGYSETILCSWSGDDVRTLEWFLEEFEYEPLVTGTNTSSLALTPDVSTDGLDDTSFTCRATTVKGDQFEEEIVVIVKGIANLLQKN